MTITVTSRCQMRQPENIMLVRMERMSEMIIGINLYSLREHCTDSAGLRYTLDRLREIGYSHVQVSGVDLDPQVIAEVLRESGQICAGTHMDWPMIRDNTDDVIEIHRLFDCKHVAIGMLPKSYMTGMSGIDRFARELPGPAQKLAEAGITLSYHNHHYEFARIADRTWLETLYDRTDSKHLSAELDTYWVQTGGGDPVQWVRKMAGREPLLHVKDRVVTLSGEERFAEIGQGNLNWEGILKAAEESGVKYVLVEQDQMYGRDSFEAVEISYKFLASMGLK